jgi:acetyl esterase/lipase
VNWVVENAARYKIDLSRVAVWGCSAGGHLAAGVAMRDAKERNPSRICQLNLVVPALSHPDAYDDLLKSILISKLEGAGLMDPKDPFRLLKPIFGQSSFYSWLCHSPEY